MFTVGRLYYKYIYTCTYFSKQYTIFFIEQYSIRFTLINRQSFKTFRKQITYSKRSFSGSFQFFIKYIQITADATKSFWWFRLYAKIKTELMTIKLTFNIQWKVSWMQETQPLWLYCCNNATYQPLHKIIVKAVATGMINPHNNIPQRDWLWNTEIQVHDLFLCYFNHTTVVKSFNKWRLLQLNDCKSFNRLDDL